jgi:hypothetical protein
VALAMSMSHGSTSPRLAVHPQAAAIPRSGVVSILSQSSICGHPQAVVMPVALDVLSSCIVTPMVYLDCWIMGFRKETTRN